MDEIGRDIHQEFEQMRAWNDGYESGFTGLEPKRRYDPLSEELHHAFMKGFLEGTETRIAQQQAKWVNQQRENKLRRNIASGGDQP